MVPIPTRTVSARTAARNRPLRPAGQAGQAGQAGRGTGLALGVLSAMCFGTSGTFGSALIGSGWSPAGAVLARVVVAAIALTGPAALALHGRWHLLRRSAWLLTTYGLVGVAACQVCYFNAIAHMPVGVAILLEYLGIVFIVVWLWVRHGQRPRPLTVAGGAGALGGLALMLDLPEHGARAGGISAAGVAWALGAAVSMAVYFFQSAERPAGSRGAGQREALPPVVLTWGGMLSGAAAIGVLGAARITPLRFAGADVTLLGDQVSWVLPVLGIGVLAAAVAYVTGVGAVRRLGAKLGSFVAMAEVLFAAAFAWVLLGQVPSPAQFLGGALILAGVVAVRLDEA